MVNYGERDPVKQPLTAEHFDQLQAAARQYHDLLAEFDKAESCGIVCQQMRADAQRHSVGIQKMLATYFPHGRPQG